MSTPATEAQRISPSSSQLTPMAASGPLLLSPEDPNGFEPYTKVKGGYQCTFKGCGKVMGKPSAMEKHFRTHTGEKPFGCPEPGCGIRFAEMGNMRRHMRIHSGERPFPCPHQGCPSQFFRRDHLHTHLKSRAHEGSAPVDISAFLEQYKQKHGITGESGFSPQMTGEIEDSPRRSKRKGEDGDNESISSGDEEYTADTPMHDATNADGPSSATWRRKKGKNIDPADAPFTLPDAALPREKTLSNTRALAELQNILTRSHPHLASASNKAIMAVTGKSVDPNGQSIGTSADSGDTSDSSEAAPMNVSASENSEQLPPKPLHPTAPGEELISPDMFDTLLNVLKPQNVARILSSSTPLPPGTNPSSDSPEPSNHSPVSGPDSGPTMFSSSGGPVQPQDQSITDQLQQGSRAKNKVVRPRGRLSAKEAIKWQSAQLLASAGLSELTFANGGGLMNLSLSSPQFQPLSNRPVVVAPSLPAPGPFSNHPMTFVPAPVTLPPSSSAAGQGHVMKTSLFKTSIQNEILAPPVTQTFPSPHHLSQYQDQTLFNNHGPLDLQHILGGQHSQAASQHVQIHLNQSLDINTVLQQQQTVEELSLNQHISMAEGMRVSPMGKRFIQHSEFSTPAQSALDNHHQVAHMRGHHNTESSQFLREQQPLLPFTLPPAPTAEQINSSHIIPITNGTISNHDTDAPPGSISIATSIEQHSTIIIMPTADSSRIQESTIPSSSVSDNQITMLRLSPSPSPSVPAGPPEVVTQSGFEVRNGSSPGAMVRLASPHPQPSSNGDRPVKSPLNDLGPTASHHLALPEYSVIPSHPAPPSLDRGTSENTLSFQTANAIQTIQAAVQRSPNLRPRGADTNTPPPIQ